MQQLDAGKSKLFVVMATVFFVSALVTICQAAEPQPAVGQQSGNVGAVTFPAYKDESNLAPELKARVTDMADELIRNLGGPDKQSGRFAEGLLVCTFVDLKKMYRTSSFGRYIAEQLMSDFQQQDFRVVELRKSNSVQVQERHGEYGLSRDPAEISHEVAAGTMLTGTYMPAGDNIIVNARIMDNRNATLLASATVIFPRNSLVDRLLADSSSATKKPAGPLYMKRLEL